jgi:hypothetical protein
MSWSETTLLNPVAWNRRVASDLRRDLYDKHFAPATPLEELHRFNVGEWTRDELVAADVFEQEFASACRHAAEQLAAAAGVPHRVTLTDTGLAVVEQVDLGELEHDQRVLLQRGVSGGAVSPSYASTVNVGAGLVPATLDTSLTAPTNTTTIVTGGATGTNNFEFVIQGVGTTVAGVCNVFVDDGSTKHLIDQVLVTAVTSNTTSVAFRQVREYTNLFLKNTWTIKVAQTVAGNQSMLKCALFAGDN